MSTGREPASGDYGAAGDWRFDDPELLSALGSVPPARIDEIAFGLVVMDRDGTVLGYNERESRLAGLSPAG